MGDEIRVPPALTKSDRCDVSACGAQAMVAVVLHSGLPLLFCLHHHRQHFEALFPVVAFTRDDSKRILNTRPGKEP